MLEYHDHDHDNTNTTTKRTIPSINESSFSFSFSRLFIGQEALAIEARYKTAMYMILNREILESDGQIQDFEVLYDGYVREVLKCCESYYGTFKKPQLPAITGGFSGCYQICGLSRYV